MRIKIPLSDISVKDGDGNPVAPEKGESVAVSLTGTVEEVDGDTAIVEAPVEPVEDRPEPKQEVSRDDLVKALEEMGDAPL